MYNILLLIVILDSFVYSSLDEITEIDILYDGSDSPLLIRTQTQHNQFTLIPYQECKIKCIKEGNTLIWVSDEEDDNKEVECIFLTIDNDECSRLVSIVLDGYDTCESLYFEKGADNTWIMITEDLYNEILDHILRAKKLDLSRKNVDIYSVTHFTRFGNSNTSFTPTSPERIVEVSDEQQILWLGELDGLCCASAILHSKRGVMKYLCLILDDDVNNPSKLLYCNDNNWQPIDQYTYNICIDRLENEIFLDLSNEVEYSNTLHITEYNQNGIKSLLFTVPINNYLTEVKDGDTIIWEASDDSTCTWTLVNLHNNTPKLLQIFEEDDIQTKITFYHKNEDSSWTPIDLENYHSILDSLNNNL